MPGHDQLTTDALAKLPSRHAVAMSVVQQFVRSQSQHSLFYALEGKKESEVWSQEGCDMNLRMSCDDLSKTSKAGGGFSSPVLKPRNPRGTEAPATCMLSKATDGEVPTNKRKREGKYVDSPNEKSIKLSRDLQKEKVKERRSIGKMLKDQDEGSSSHRPPSARKKNICEKSSKSRKKEAHNDDEVKERLTQRRARRRWKRKIVDPRPETEASLSCMESDDPVAVQETTSSKKSRTSKKKPEDKLPAGLALLHGFSAKNLAKHRLTIGHGASTAFGVFGKGKASDRSKVLGKKGGLSKVFDEEVFLKKKDRRVEEEPDTSRRAKKTIIQDSMSDANFSESSSSSVLMVSEQLSDSGKHVISDSSSISKHLEASKESAAGSVVWDIEREFLPVVKKDFEKDRLSVIANTKDCGWAAPSIMSSPASRLSESLVHGNVSTVAPSHSASQISPQYTAEYTPRPQFSRYFASQKAVATEDDNVRTNCELVVRSTSPTNQNSNFAGEKEPRSVDAGSSTDNLLGDEVPEARYSSGSRCISHESQDHRFIQEHVLNSDPADGITILYNACMAEDPDVNSNYFKYISGHIYDEIPSDALVDTLLEEYDEHLVPVQEDTLEASASATYDELRTCNLVSGTNLYFGFSNCAYSEAENDDAYSSETGVGADRSAELGRYQDIIHEEIPSCDGGQDEFGRLTTCSQSRDFDNCMDEVFEENGFLGVDDQTAQVSASDYDVARCDGNSTTGSLISTANSSVSNYMVERTTYIAPFSEGRSLLLGIDDIPQPSYESCRNTIENVETMVAKRIRDHWHPLKL